MLLCNNLSPGTPYTPTILHIIYHNFSKNSINSTVTTRLYMVLVRPHLEYAAQVLNLHLVKGLVRVQKFALRISVKNYYEELLEI